MSETDTPNVAAFVGAAGGAGTTRTVVEVAGALAAAGDEVAVLDAAFATQGLSRYVTGRIDPDMTALLTDAADEALSQGFVDLDLGADVPGRVAVCPAHAPFERLARAKAVDAARQFESRVETAASRFDHVLVDVPPVASNEAVAAVNAAARVVVVTPASERGVDAVQQCHDRLADVGAEASLVVSTRGDLETADVSIPETGRTGARAAPACLGGEGAFAATVGRVAAVVTGRRIEAATDVEGGLLDSIGEYVGW
ncbi:AAA family ATPase [Halobellus sp. GM3]|uniref:AAA family ATPase n=1 Tax=Halobellus sp. GM3 TaxID=3458410 RepID=UPI00403DBAD9